MRKRRQRRRGREKSGPRVDTRDALGRRRITRPSALIMAPYLAARRKIDAAAGFETRATPPRSLFGCRRAGFDASLRTMPGLFRAQLPQPGPALTRGPGGRLLRLIMHDERRRFVGASDGAATMSGRFPRARRTRFRCRCLMRLVQRRIKSIGCNCLAVWVVTGFGAIFL